MSVQTSYGNVAAGAHGQIYDIGPRDVVSGIIEEAAGIEFGLAVSRGTNDGQVTLGGSALLGFTVRDLAREGVQGSGVVLFKDEETAPIMRKGYMLLTCPSGCTPGQPVNYNTTTGIVDQGAPGAGELAIANATWESTIAAGGLAVIRINS